MQVDSIAGLSSVSGSVTTGSSSIGSNRSVNFSDVLNNALEQVIDAQEANEESSIALISGEDEGLENTMIAAEKAELMLSLTITVRNKLVEAYNEVMKMQL